MTCRRIVGSSFVAVSLLAGCPSTEDPANDDFTTTLPMTSGIPPAQTDDGSSDGPGATSTPMMDSSTSGPPPGGSSESTAPADSSDGGPPPVCGNNIIEGDEVCDLTQVNGETCESLGYMGGTLGCLLNCTDYNLNGCFICGNGVIDMAEDCEGTVPDGIDCESMGFEGGWVQCGADCFFDTSECSICGDGIQQGDEDCDMVDLGGETCMSIGFDMGSLACNAATCSYNYAGCSGGMYFQDFEAGAPIPAEFTVGGTQPFLVDGTNPIAGSFSAANGNINHSQNSTMAMTASFAVAGNITFTYETSTEGSFDYLEFWVDGGMVQEWSGINGPAMFMHAVGAGVHDIEWRYTKDGSVDAGLDTVWVDDITLTPGVPI